MKYRIYNKMEERIKIFCFGQEFALTINQITNLEPFIKSQQIKKLKLPSALSKFEVNLQVLHSCLYYLISIEKGIYSLSKINFRQKCLTGLQSYYIKRKMNFQLYQYGYLCSKILSYSLEKSLHIIYYLIYERLASKPYIITLINQADKVRKCARKQTCKSQIEQSAISNERDSRHLTVFMQNGQIQVQNFKRDLRKIFNSQNDLRKTGKRNENKRYFNLKKLYPDQEFEYKFDQSVDQLALKNCANKVINIPLKVGPYDHSSVINRLKFHSGNTSTVESNDMHKNMVRRQKFKEDFNGCEKYESIKRVEKQQVKKQWGTQKNIIDDRTRGNSNIYRMQKHPYEYFRDVTSNIKTKNRHLDLIRTECIHNNLIKSNIINRQEDCRANNQFISMTGVNTPTLIASRSQNILFNLNKLKFQDKQNMLQGMKMIEQILKTQLSPKKQYQKVMSEATPRVNDTLNGVITRKNDKINQQQQHLSLFSRNVKTKYKLQKYKQQYRHFLKNQLFQKIKNAS